MKLFLISIVFIVLNLTLPLKSDENVNINDFNESYTEILKENFIENVDSVINEIRCVSEQDCEKLRNFNRIKYLLESQNNVYLIMWVHSNNSIKNVCDIVSSGTIKINKMLFYSAFIIDYERKEVIQLTNDNNNLYILYKFPLNNDIVKDSLIEVLKLTEKYCTLRIISSDELLMFTPNGIKVYSIATLEVKEELTKEQYLQKYCE